MSYNLYARMRALFPGARRQVGTVTSVSAAGAIVTLPSGATVSAIGSAQIGEMVYIRDGQIEALAPTLPVVEIEI